MLKEFKEFAMKGNVVDLAIGVVIGAAFGKIVDSLVGDVIMPIIGAIGGADFSNYFIKLSSAGAEGASYAQLKEAGVPMIGYGQFLTVVVNFIIIAWVLFLIVKGMNSMKRAEAAAAPPAPPAPTTDQVLLGEIRDLLAKR
jgi:large conductance mechanosensitive channel